MISHFWRKLTIILIIYLGFLIYHFPASYLVYRILSTNLVIQGTSGTLWQGHINQLQYKQIVLNNIQWRLAFNWLKPEIKWMLNDPVIKAKGSIPLRLGMPAQLTNVELNMPAEQIGPFVMLPWIGIKSGEVFFYADLVAIDLEKQWFDEIKGKLDWQQGVINTFNGDIDLGTTQVSIDCQQGKINALWQQSSPSVESRGTVSLDHENYQINGMVTLGKALSLADIEKIELIGERDQQGNIRIQQSGQW